MKKNWLITGVGIVTGVAIGLAGLQLVRGSSPESTCISRKSTAVSHKVVFENDEVTPQYTMAARCDTLIITNLDAKARRIAFGQKTQHISYAGNGEQVLNQGKSLTITLTQTGTYHFHDHLDENTGGEITIK